MPIITTREVVRRTAYQEQSLVRETLAWGQVIWRTTIETEHIPMHHLISVGCLGYGEWQSKWADIIDKQRASARASSTRHADS